jgi:DNA-binding transcriptional MerR regulator
LTPPRGQGQHCFMYSTHQFAELTGVSVKALRHYERVGLLAPRRTRARYRRYAVGDLQRIERILALKSLGLSLKAIKTLLTRGPVGLRAHCESLVETRARLDRAISTLQSIEQDPHPPTAMKRFMAEAGWDRWEVKRQSLAVARPPDRVPASAIELFREIEAVVDNLRPSGQGRRSPAGTEVADASQGQALAARCRAIVAPETIDAWRRRARWPPGLRRYVASCYAMEPDAWERVVTFIEAQDGQSLGEGDCLLAPQRDERVDFRGTTRG